MSSEQPKIIICLGNPGKEYEKTRHNAGFRVADELAIRFNADFRKKWRISSYYCRVLHDGSDIIVIKPRTYMNRSGLAVAACMSVFGINASDMIVVVDDVNLTIGRIRLRRSGSDGGHNGIASIIGSIGTDEFARCRIGVGNADIDVLVEHVLGAFTWEEEEKIAKVIPVAADAVLDFIKNGIESAMNKYNCFSLEGELSN